VPGPSPSPGSAARTARPAPPATPLRRAVAPPATPSTPTSTPSYADRPWLASYPVGVPADYDFPKVPLTRLLDDAAASFPDRVALAFLGARLTYRQLKAAVDFFATALAGLGVAKGDRVAIVLPNCPQNVITFFATLRLGAVVVEHNPLYTETELRHQLVDCGAKVVVCLDRVYDTLAAVRSDAALEHVVVTSIADYLPSSARLKLRLPLAAARRSRADLVTALPKGAPVKHFLALLKGAGAASRQTPVEPGHDLALLQYTGGTTGVSKGAMLTHLNLVSDAYMNRLWDTGATAGTEVTLAVLPLFHAFGLTVAMNNTILLGGTLVLLPRFDLDLLLAAIDEWKPTLFPGVPPIYQALTDSPKASKHNLTSLRLCVSGAMRLPVDVQAAFEQASGARLVEGYGMTETSPSTHCNPTTGERRPGSIGLPLPGTRCRVVDQADPAKQVPIGSPGELAIGGPQVFAGYWGRADQEGVFTGDGYVLTGDVAVMDEAGYFTVVGRKKDMVIAGGFNIYPSEVEDVLRGIEGVQDAVVVGVPDRYRGETTKAFVVRAPGATLTEQDVRAHCARALTAYKVPKVVEFRDELPRSAVGKVLRRVLVEQERDAAEPRPRKAPTKKAPPAATAPTKRAPTKKAPTKQAPITKAATKKAPTKPASITKAATKKAPTKKAATKKAPIKRAPNAKAPAQGAPPAKQVPARKAPAQKAPTRPASIRRAPAKTPPTLAEGPGG